MKIAIIGAGLCGLMTGYLLSREFEVTIYEKDANVGGLTASVDCDGIRIEKYNHFFSENDRELIKILGKLNLGRYLYWTKAKQAFITKDRLYSLTDLWDLLCFHSLRWKQKIKLALFLLRCHIKKSPVSLSGITAEDWVKTECGDEVFKRFFWPFLNFKFSGFTDVSAAYLWARIKESKQNKLGYLQGGTEILFKKLTEDIRRQQGKILLNNRVSKIEREDKNKWRVYVDKKQEIYDLVISCIPYVDTERLYPEISQKIIPAPEIKYLSIHSYLLQLRQPLKEGYWLFMLNFADDKNRVLIDTSVLTGNTFVYFPVYSLGTTTDRLDKNKIWDDCLKSLKAINPNFSSEWIKSSLFFCDKNVEPVITRKFFNILKDSPVDYEGLYSPELIYEPGILKTLNSAVIKSKCVANLIKDKYASNNSS